MQTFLPYSDFRRTAAVLDIRRLGKQRVETLQILRALTFEDYGWRNHPAVTMWTGHTAALVTYGAVITRRWQAEGYADTILPQLLEFLGPEPLPTQRDLKAHQRLPSWIGSKPLHRSHQAALVRKDPAHYGPLFPGVDPELPYVWPESSPPPRPGAPISAWVVRGTREDIEAMHSGGFVGVRPLGDEGAQAPTGVGTRDTKRRRQINVFFDVMRIGDRVVVPDSDVLLVGEIVAGYEWRDHAPDGLCHRRRVRWNTKVHRSDLVRPVHLQDPRVVFGLRDEPLLAGVA